MEAGLERTECVRAGWTICRAPDVLISARCQRTVVPVLDFAIGGDEFVTMAGPCSVESEAQLMATAQLCAVRARMSCVEAPSSRDSPYAFQAWASKV